jgi:hypothetical protein
MDATRFDRLARSLAARRLSRRTALRAGGTGVAATAALTALRGSAVAQDATPPAGQEPMFLFVQTAASGTFQANPAVGTPVVDGTPTPGGGADYLLTLENHHGGTIYFSDRPYRIVGDAPTQQFLDGLGFSPENPPNAALVTYTEDGTQEVVVVELMEPSYDEASGTLTYGVIVLEEYQGEGLQHVAAQQQDAELPGSFGHVSLFIDDCPDYVFRCWLGCYQVGHLGAHTNVGTCWSWSDFECQPCGGGWDSINWDDIIDHCNFTFEEECRGECLPWGCDRGP